MYFNSRSLLPKIDELRLLCGLHQPNCVCVVETWLDPEILDSEIQIQGFNTIRLDRNRHGGGVIVYVNSSFTLSCLCKGPDGLEFILFSVSCGNSKMTLGVLYRPPNACSSLLNTLFAVICNCLNEFSISDFMLVGDFNIDFLNPHSTQFSKLSAIMSSLFLSQVVNEPTRPSVNGSASSLLDLIFVSNPLCVISCQTIPALSYSHHLCLPYRCQLEGLQIDTKASSKQFGDTHAQILT